MDRKKSGFDAPTIGKIVPEGTTWKKNPDGTLTPIYPKAKTEKKDKPKSQKR